MQTRNSFRAAAVALFAVLLGACTALGMPEPRDFNDRASYAYDLATEAAATVSAMAAAGELELDAADAILERVAAYKSAIDAARALYAVNQVDAEQRLAAIHEAIGVLLEDLENRRSDADG